jgi:hypothetical protein
MTRKTYRKRRGAKHNKSLKLKGGDPTYDQLRNKMKEIDQLVDPTYDQLNDVIQLIDKKIKEFVYTLNLYDSLDPLMYKHYLPNIHNINIDIERLYDYRNKYMYIINQKRYSEIKTKLNADKLLSNQFKENAAQSKAYLNTLKANNGAVKGYMKSRRRSIPDIALYGNTTEYNNTSIVSYKNTGKGKVPVYSMRKPRVYNNNANNANNKCGILGCTRRVKGNTRSWFQRGINSILGRKPANNKKTEPNVMFNVPQAPPPQTRRRRSFS